MSGLVQLVDGGAEAPETDQAGRADRVLNSQAAPQNVAPTSGLLYCRLTVGRPPKRCGARIGHKLADRRSAIRQTGSGRTQLTGSLRYDLRAKPRLSLLGRGGEFNEAQVNRFPVGGIFGPDVNFLPIAVQLQLTKVDDLKGAPITGGWNTGGDLVCAGPDR